MMSESSIVSSAAAPDGRVGGIRIGGIQLAAGESRRMGGPNKLEILVDGVPLVRRTAQTLLAAGVNPLVVVLGHAVERITPLIEDLPVRWVVNDDYRQGQPSSVQAGLRGLSDPLDAFLVCLSDLPLLAVDPLRSLIRAFADRGSRRIQVPVHEGARGNPVIFEGGLRDQLLAQAGGPRAWIDAHPEAVRRLPVTHAGFIRDLDTPDDVAALAQRGDAPQVRWR